MKKFNDERDWFFEKRLGLFIHWGLYAIHGLQEQEQQRYKVPSDEYAKLLGKFKPRKFDPEKWLDLAQGSGMEYMVLTTKHHDGFCLWDSALTDFNSMKAPCGRDIAGELAAACQKRSFPLEFYYSVVDWKHPAYPNIGRHHEIETDKSSHDWPKYLDYLKGQIRELCSKYGKIHGIWWDMNVPGVKDPSVSSMIRELQPAALVNNRGFDDGDYSTPERDFDPEGANPDDMAFKRATEACQSVGVNSWGFRKMEDYFSVLYFLRNISKTLAMGGNYLLNVGPDADGEIPAPARKVLKGVGEWMKKVRESFVEPAPGLLAKRDVLTTRRGSTLYIHCPFGLESSTLSLRPLTEAPKKATLLNTGSEIEIAMEPIVYERNQPIAPRLRGIPVDKLSGTVPVFKIELRAAPQLPPY